MSKEEQKEKDVDDLDVYSDDDVNDLVESDEISDEEAGFMQGYLEEEEWSFNSKIFIGIFI